MLMLVISRGKARAVEDNMSRIPISITLECSCMTTADIQVTEMFDNGLVEANEGVLNKREVVTTATLYLLQNEGVVAAGTFIQSLPSQSVRSTPDNVM